MADKLVFSTDRTLTDKKSKSEDKKISSGPTKMRLESNGRGGKQVTVLFNLPFSADEAKSHQRSLQSQLGTGGTFKDDTIEFRGDVRDRVEQYFQKLGLKIIRAGG